jgi:hypothetical protein
MYPENHRYNNRNYLVDEWMYDTTPEITQFFKGPVFVFKFLKVVEGSWIYTLIDHGLAHHEKPASISESNPGPPPKNVIAKKVEPPPPAVKKTRSSGNINPPAPAKNLWNQPDASSTSPSESPRNVTRAQGPIIDLKNNPFSLYSDLSMSFIEDIYEPQITADLYPPYVLGNPSENLSRLSDLAEEEIWDKKGKPLAVLFEYIALIFRGAVRANAANNGRFIAVNKDQKKCAVNTGLMTRRGSNEYILALCQRLPDNRFAVRSFITWWDAVQSHGFEHCDMPHLVTFFPRSEIMFDNKLHLQFHVEHMIDKCEHQFPHRWRNLKREELSLFLNGLSESLKRQIEQDSNSVVPAVDTNGIDLTLQYLLPLRVEKDLVIAVEKKGQYYLAHTILRAETEYARARVLGKQKGNMLNVLIE